MRLNSYVAPWLCTTLLLTGCADNTISVTNSIVTTRQNAELEKPTPQSAFKLDDIVEVVVFVTWPDVTTSGGLHHAEWNWYKDGQVVSHSHNLVRLKVAPAN